MRRPVYSNVQFLKDLWSVFGNLKLKFTFWYIIRLISSTSWLLITYATAKIVDFFAVYNSGDSLNSFYFWVGVIFVTFSVAAIVRQVSKYNLGSIGREAQRNVRLLALNSLLNRDLSWHEEEVSGSKIQRINSGAGGVKAFMKFLRQNSTDIIVGIFGVFVILSALSLKLGLIILLQVIVYFVHEFYINKRMSEAQHAVTSYRENVSGKLTEYTANIATVKSMGADHTVKKKASRFEERLNQLAKKVHLVSARKWTSINLINALFLAILLIVAGLDIVSGKFSVGFIVLFFEYIRQTRKSLSDISGELDNIVEAKYSFYRITPLLEEFESDDGTKKFPKTWRSIIFNNVSFSYKKKKVLDNLSFTIKKGEKIGIVGVSGVGKSTIFKLLLNLYKPESGMIKIDKTDFTNISRSSLSKRITIVPQEVELFNMSLKENIVLLSSSYPLEKAIELACCKDIVSRLPNGLNTLVGEKGVRLSGGEKQRVGIARAIYANTDVILLDESTSHLDSKTEAAIQRNIEKYLKGYTVITIAHRISTLRNVDKILVMDSGKVIESGSYSELMKKRGMFYELAKVQKE